MTESARATVLRKAIEACVTGDFEVLPELFTEDVSAWSPAIHVTSAKELAEALAWHEEALTEVEVQIDALDVFADKGAAEFRVTARFSEPFVIDDSVVEPNGHLLVIGSAVIVDFDGDRISAFRNYFDEMTLLEQMLIPA